MKGALVVFLAFVAGMAVPMRADAASLTVGDYDSVAESFYGAGTWVGVYTAVAGCTGEVTIPRPQVAGNYIEDAQTYVFTDAPSAYSDQGAFADPLARASDGNPSANATFAATEGAQYTVIFAVYDAAAAHGGQTYDDMGAVEAITAPCGAPGGGSDGPQGTAAAPFIMDPSEGWGRFQAAVGGLTVLLLAVLTVRSFGSRTGD